MKQGKINPEKIKKILKTQYMKRFFSQHLDEIFPEVEKIKSLKIETIKKFRKKDYFSYVVRYQLKGNLVSGESCEKAFYGSTDNLKNSRQRQFLILKNLEKQNFTSNSWFTPYPLAYFSEFNLLLQFLPGDTLSSFIMKYRKNLPEISDGLGEFLAELHQIKIKFAKKLVMVEEKRSFLDYTTKVVKKKYSSKTPEILELATRIFLYEQKFYNKKVFTFIHGDLHPSNIIIDADSNIGMIDFSRSVIFDPARDAGNFIGQFQFGWFDYNLNRILSEKEKKELVGVFLEKYLSKTKYSSDFKKRIKLQEAQVIVQIIAHIINWKEINKKTKKNIDFLIKQANKCLEKV